jgi:hypothetical protein
MATSPRISVRALCVALAVAACQPAGSEREVSAERSPADGEQASEPKTPSSAAELACADPVRPDDTAASLQQRFGEQARTETLYGPEGIELPAVVLWPANPKRRVEVAFTEESRQHVSMVQLTRPSEWHVAGLSVGDPIADVDEANGRPFELWGFSWDYGGYVSDLKGGKLAARAGGCQVMLRLAPQDDAVLPDALMGEVLLSSDDQRLAEAGVRIEELALALSPE